MSRWSNVVFFGLLHAAIAGAFAAGVVQLDSIGARIVAGCCAVFVLGAGVMVCRRLWP